MVVVNELYTGPRIAILLMAPILLVVVVNVPATGPHVPILLVVVL